MNVAAAVEKAQRYKLKEHMYELCKVVNARPADARPNRFIRAGQSDGVNGELL